MRFTYTDGNNPGFVMLCSELDAFLNHIAGGEDRRVEYISYNQLNDIHDVGIAYDGNIPIGCAGFKKYDNECAEVKRVFVRQLYRGNGISKKLMHLLEEKAKAQGYDYLILESGSPLIAAMALYRNIGYEVTSNYGPYQNMSGSICMRKKL